MAMKRLIISTILLISSFGIGMAQKYAFIDSEYILKNVPAYQAAQDQLDKASQKWQQEVDLIMDEVKKMYKTYQNDLVFLSEDAKVKRENEIVAKEKEGMELKKKYFGPEGELFKKRESLVKPIQDEVFNAIKEIADAKDYVAIWDKARNQSLIYGNPKYDISDEVLAKLGYSK